MILYIEHDNLSGVDGFFSKIASAVRSVVHTVTAPVVKLEKAVAQPIMSIAAPLVTAPIKLVSSLIPSGGGGSSSAPAPAPAPGYAPTANAMIGAQTAAYTVAQAAQAVPSYSGGGSGGGSGGDNAPVDSLIDIPPSLTATDKKIPWGMITTAGVLAIAFLKKH